MPESRFTQGAVLTTLLAGLAVLLLAAGRTVGDPQPRPTRLARPPRRRPRPTRSPLRRLLRLPVLATGAPCPVEQAHRVDPAFAEVLGTGPAYPTAGAEPWWQGWVEGGWYYAKVLWVANPATPARSWSGAGSWTGRASFASARAHGPIPSCCSPPRDGAQTDSDWFN